MKNAICLAVTFAFSLFTFALSAQSNLQQPTSINSTGAAPAASAMLDVQATDKGMLVPRMTLTQRLSIASPANGLLVFDITTNSFWFYNGVVWRTLSSSNTPFLSFIADADSNTIVQTEKVFNEDIIRFDLGGTEKMVLRKNASGAARLELPDVAGTTIIGQAAGVNNIPISDGSGENNTFVGYRSGNGNTTGSGNTASGASSFYSNSSGSLNIANGVHALYHNTTGNENTATGSYSLTSNTTGQYNTANGSNALLNNTTASFNTATGAGALRSNTTGYYNTANGFNALYSTTTGIHNTSGGGVALYSNTTGYSNTAHGVAALYLNTTGYENTATGANTLHENTIGTRNTANGYEALYYNTTAGGNTAVGYAALRNTTTGYGNTGIGDAALISNGTGNYNTALGSAAIFSTSGNNNTAIGYFSLATNETGSWNTAIGEFTNVSSNSANSRTMLGTRAYSECDNCVVIGSLEGKNGSTVTAKIGIGTSNPTHLLEVGFNDAYKPGTNTWGITSDQRLKENVKPYSDGLAAVLDIKPVTFHYTDNSGFDPQPEYVGILAQELQKVAPYMVSENERKLKDGTSGTFLTVDNGAMTYMLINAVKELEAENAALKSQLDKITAALQAVGISVEH